MKHDLSIQQKKLLSFLCIILVLLLLAYPSLKYDIFQELENRTWDWRLIEVAKQSKADPSIKIIAIDQSSIDQMVSNESLTWPWPRSIYVPVIKYLEQAGAKGAAFDILFTEFSQIGHQEDIDFRNGIEGALPVVMAAALRTGKSSTEILEERFPIFKAKQLRLDNETSFSSRFPSNRLLNYSSITLPIKELLDVADAIGNVSVLNDDDGIYRHYLANQFIDNIPVLTLPFALYNATQSEFSSYFPPLNKDQLMTLRFAGSGNTYQTYSFYSILKSYQQLSDGQEPYIPLNEFKDSYVFIGMNAPGLLDLRPTPLDSKSPGVEINATALDNYLNKSFIREASLPENLLYTLIFALIISGTALFSVNLSNQVILILLSFTALIMFSYYLAIEGLWIDMVIPFLSSSMSLLCSVAIQYKLQGAQTRFIKKAFRYYVSPEVIEKIIEDPSILSLGGERRELSIYFCDIAGFTSISESMDPAVLVQFLNKFLTAMTSVILSHGGTVDKYVGDAIVAFWNAPLPDPDHAQRAVKAAIECQKKLDEIRAELLREFGHEVHLRIGLHTGIASVGNFGSLERFNYTVIGDSANLASRLEGANKGFGTDILFSDATYQALNDSIPCLRVATIKVIGRDKPIAVYSPNRKFSNEQLVRWNSMVTFFEKGELSEAASLLNNFPDSKLSRLYRERIEAALQKNDPVSWSPVFNLTEK